VIQRLLKHTRIIEQGEIMEKHHTTQLDAQINALHTSLARLSSEEPLTELIQIVHRPGWTTVAEEAFFMGILEAMGSQTKTLSAMKQVLLSGAAKVELNPQPLPPGAR
jgi:hypothetical protein